MTELAKLRRDVELLGQPLGDLLVDLAQPVSSSSGPAAEGSLGSLSRRSSTSASPSLGQPAAASRRISCSSRPSSSQPQAASSTGSAVSPRCS
ncbi:MAG: hypothetical protein ACJ75M_14700, partial [Actinomycetes bacterium]